MTRLMLAALASVAAAGCANFQNQGTSGVQRLYVMNCGEGVAGDISRWSPGVNEGKSMDFVDNCYLIKHAKGWMLWDTGIMDAVAGMPDGLKPADPRRVRCAHTPLPPPRAPEYERVYDTQDRNDR